MNKLQDTLRLYVATFASAFWPLKQQVLRDRCRQMSPDISNRAVRWQEILSRESFIVEKHKYLLSSRQGTKEWLTPDENAHGIPGGATSPMKALQFFILLAHPVFVAIAIL